MVLIGSGVSGWRSATRRKVRGPSFRRAENVTQGALMAVNRQIHETETRFTMARSVTPSDMAARASRTDAVGAERAISL